MFNLLVDDFVTLGLKSLNLESLEVVKSSPLSLSGDLLAPGSLGKLCIKVSGLPSLVKSGRSHGFFDGKGDVSESQSSEVDKATIHIGSINEARLTIADIKDKT